MDKVRLEVRETSRNSEKPKPKASKPPMLNVKRQYRRGESSVTRNNFSEVLRLSPAGTEERIRTDFLGVAALQVDRQLRSYNSFPRTAYNYRACPLMSFESPISCRDFIKEFLFVLLMRGVW